jgi:hypothetical protein
MDSQHLFEELFEFENRYWKCYWCNRMELEHGDWLRRPVTTNCGGYENKTYVPILFIETSRG